MRKKSRNKRNVAVAVMLAEQQRSAIEETASIWGIGMAIIGRRLIQYFISNKVPLADLLKKYNAGFLQEKHREENPFSSFRNYKLRIYLTQEEKRELDVLGAEWCCLPGEVARILLELFLAGVIKKSDIWE